MSYCRLSDNSDVYVYQGKDYYYVHLAAGVERVAELMKQHNIEDRYFETPDEVLEYLITVKLIGLQVPEYAIDILKDEIKL